MRKWAVVTGAGSGIGAALSKKLVEKNYSVIGVGRRLKALERTEQEIERVQRDIWKGMETAEGIKQLLENADVQ